MPSLLVNSNGCERGPGRRCCGRSSTLRQKANLIRRDELERARAELKDGDPQQVLDRFSRRMFERLLSVPLDQLRSGDLPFDGPSADYLRRLFALDERPES